MKRLIALLLAATMTISLAACGGSGAASSAPAQESTAAEETEATEETTPNCKGIV